MSWKGQHARKWCAVKMMMLKRGKHESAECAARVLKRGNVAGWTRCKRLYGIEALRPSPPARTS
eukprot:365983-Chlamydomonas_euryale.AAC.20